LTRNSTRSSGNTFGDTVSQRLWPLENEALCAEARRRTGLGDFGDPPIAPALSMLVHSLEHEANLHPLGRFLMRSYLRRLLETRLRLTKAWSEHLEALDNSPLRRPIFITSLPRTASTFFHELLAEDPAHRAPRVWEVMFPVSSGKPDRGWREPRVWRTAADLWWFRRLAPRADAVHPIRARTPHECAAIHSYTLCSDEFISICRVPGYETFLHLSDVRPTYAWQKRFLQHLQWRDPERRWVLKAPFHVYGLEALFSVFPDAFIIQTHRNPAEVLRSSIHVSEVLHGLFARPGDRDQLAAWEAQDLTGAIERLTRFRDTHPQLASRFVDVNYSELVANPVTVLRRVYQHLEIPWSQTVAERMRQLALRRSRYPAHRTTRASADVRLDFTAQVSRFDDYCQRFGIPCEQTG